MLVKKSSVKTTREYFKWEIPEHYNIGVDVCDRLAALVPDQVAILHDDGLQVEEVTYDQLKCRSNALANLLQDIGVGAGDRIGILLPQNPWTAVAHIAAWKMGAISIPLFMLFGREALEYRLLDSSAKVVVTGVEGAAKIEQIRDQPRTATTRAGARTIALR